MTDHADGMALKKLYEAFRDVPKPFPLAQAILSRDPLQVDRFNSLDWENVTFKQFMDTEEGWIICEIETFRYLIPRLFRMVVREHKTTEAIHNVTQDIEFRLTNPHLRYTVASFFSREQKDAIVEIFAYLDTAYFDDDEFTTASAVAAALEI